MREEDKLINNIFGNVSAEEIKARIKAINEIPKEKTEENQEEYCEGCTL